MSNVLTRLRLRRSGAPAATTPAEGAAPRTRFGAWLGRPMTSFHLIIAVAALLTSLGLIMVLSASGVHSYDEDGSPWVIFGKQLIWTLVGLFAFYAAMRMRVQTMRSLAFSGFAVSVVLLVLVLVPGIGKEANGSRGWFVVAGLSMQPSELAKIAFAIWGAHLLAARRMERASLKEMLIPLVPAAVIALALIVAQPDLGQTVSLGIILLALLWYAGLPLRVFLSSLFAVVVSAGVLAMAEGYRSDRVMSWLNPGADSQGSGYQAKQARFALANGGVFGDGLGQGTAKWNYLPNAHNDFIFAIIGEELGFIGAAGLLCLFGLFAYTGMRIARRSVDPFLRLLTATATMWVLGQVFINVGYVIGLLPVTGLQLPLISAGGTSTATTLLIIGVIANAARHEPEAVAALRAGRDDRVNRLLRLPLPAAVRAEPHRGAARPVAVALGEAGRQGGSQTRQGQPAQTPCGRPVRCDAQGIMEAVSAHLARLGSATRADGLAHWKVNVTGEWADIGSSRRWRDGRPRRTRHGGRRCAQRAGPRGADHRPRHPSAVWKPGWSPSAGTTSSSSPPVPLPRKPTGDLLRLPVRVRRAVKQTRTVLDNVDADVVDRLRRLRRVARLPGGARWRTAARGCPW